VFTSAGGDVLRSGNSCRRVWVKTTAVAGLDGVRFHDLRHAHAALSIEAGELSKVIRSRVGHASLRTTLDPHCHLFEGMDEVAADRLNEVLREVDVDSLWTASGGEVVALRP
jgi:integrase